MSAEPMANKLTYQKQSKRDASAKPNAALFRNPSAIWDGAIAGRVIESTYGQSRSY
jgi:hypothetical protein